MDALDGLDDPIGHVALGAAQPRRFELQALGRHRDVQPRAEHAEDMHARASRRACQLHARQHVDTERPTGRPRCPERAQVVMVGDGDEPHTAARRSLSHPLGRHPAVRRAVGVQMPVVRAYHEPAQQLQPSGPALDGDRRFHGGLVVGGDHVTRADRAFGGGRVPGRRRGVLTAVGDLVERWAGGHDRGNRHDHSQDDGADDEPRLRVVGARGLSASLSEDGDERGHHP